MDQRKWAKIMIPYLPKLCSDGQLAHLMRDPPYILSAAAPPAPSAHTCIFTIFLSDQASKAKKLKKIILKLHQFTKTFVPFYPKNLFPW